MTSVHLAVTHFCLAFLVLLETEYLSQTEHAIPYPDVFFAPPANMHASHYPNSLSCWHRSPSDRREPPTAVFWRAAALDYTICVLWFVGLWQYTSLLQEWLNPDYQPRAGMVYRPFTTAVGFEVIWTSKGLVGHLLQVIMMRPIRVMNSFIFVYMAEFLGD